MLKTVPIPYITTLEQLKEEFNDSLTCFATFRVQTEDGLSIVSNVTIANCRFRPMDGNHGIVEVRSCDCGGSLCMHPTQKIFISSDQFKNYIFVEQINLNYIFAYLVKQ